MSDPDFDLTDELASFIEELHDSEINGEISWFYDGVWGAKLGDPSNGYAAEATFASLPEAVKWLRPRCGRFGRSWRSSTRSRSLHRCQHKESGTELADGEEAAAMSDDKLHIDPAELRAKVFKDRITPGDCRVEKIDEDSGYEDIQVFTGPDARWQAIRYAGDKYACST